MIRLSAHLIFFTSYQSYLTHLILCPLFVSHAVALHVYYGQSTAPELQALANCSGGEESLDACLMDYNTTALTCTHAGVQCERK